MWMHYSWAHLGAAQKQFWQTICNSSVITPILVVFTAVSRLLDVQYQGLQRQEMHSVKSKQILPPQQPTVQSHQTVTPLSATGS